MTEVPERESARRRRVTEDRQRNGVLTSTLLAPITTAWTVLRFRHFSHCTPPLSCSTHFITPTTTRTTWPTGLAKMFSTTPHRQRHGGTWRAQTPSHSHHHRHAYVTLGPCPVSCPRSLPSIFPHVRTLLVSSVVAPSKSYSLFSRICSAGGIAFYLETGYFFVVRIL